MDEPRVEDDDAIDEDLGPLDLSELDPESWRPGIPWLPSFGLIIAVLSLPIVSLVLTGPLGASLARDAPDLLWVVDVWRTLIAGALIGGAILVLMVPVSARVARGRPGLIFGLLENGFPVGVILVTLLVVVHTLLAVGIVLAIERLLLGFTITATAVVILVPGVAGATYLATTGLAALRSTASDEPAVTLTRERAPGLFEMLEALAERIGVALPDGVLLGPTMAFWTGTGTFRALDRIVSGTVIHCSLPQLALLSRTDVEGILAHELAHELNGDVEIGARLSPAWDRMARSIDALDRESTGLGRIAAKPGLLWLEFAMDAIGAVVAERRRASEAAADAVAANVVGTRAVATGLIGGYAVGVLEGEWAAEVDRTLDAGEGDPVKDFVTSAREALAGVTSQQILEDSLGDIGPSHPAIVSRVRAVDGLDVPFELTDAPALDLLVTDPVGETGRLLAALRAGLTEREMVRLNEPGLTPGVVGWVLIGIVFASIFGYRFFQDDGLGGDGPLIFAIIGGLWLLFPIVYPWIQREVRIGGGQVRMRSWWWRWLDSDGSRLRWARLRWSDDVRLSIAFEGFMTLTSGTDRLRWWGGVWPKRELIRLQDELQARGATVLASSNSGAPTDERHAVVWYAGGRFLVPRIKLTTDGSLIEMRPVSAYPAGMLRLSLSLVDRLDEPAFPAGSRDTYADPDHLASLAKLYPTAFERDAVRLTIDGDRESWTIRIDGREDVWTVDRSTDEADLTELIFDILDIPKAARERRTRTKPASSETDKGAYDADTGDAID